MSLFIPSSPTQTSSQANVKFEATTKNITTLSNLLASITPINHQCLLIIKPEGLTFYTVYNHLINILLIVDLSLFKLYTLNKDNFHALNSFQYLENTNRLSLFFDLIMLLF